MRARPRSSTGAAWIDVREQDEWDEGHIPGAVHIPRGNLESRIENVVPDKATPVVHLLRLRQRARRSRPRRCSLSASSGRCRSPAAITDWKRNG